MSPHLPKLTHKTPKPAVHTTSSGRPTIHVKVYSPYRSYVDEDIYSISALNQTGPFDILPGHHNFLTLLVPGELVVATIHGEKRVRIARGVMHVRQNNVTVFLDV